MSIIIACFLRRLPQSLLRILAKEMADQSLVWKDGVNIEPRELARIFRFLNEDGSGMITTDETVHGFERSGLTFKTDAERKIFRSHVANEHGSGQVVEPDRELGLDEFRDHFKGFLGGKLVRRLHRHSSAADADQSVSGPSWHVQVASRLALQRPRARVSVCVSENMIFARSWSREELGTKALLSPGGEDVDSSRP